MAPLFARRPMLHSRDIEETRAFLAGKGIELELACGKVERQCPLNVRINGTYLSSLFLGYVAYGTPARVSFSPQSTMWRDCDIRSCTAVARLNPPHGDHWIQLPLQGGIGASIAGRMLDCGAQRGLVLSPSATAALRSDADGVRLSVAIREDALARHLAVLLGDALNAPLRFDPEMRLDGGPGQRFAAILRWAASELDTGGLLADPLVAGEFERFVMTWLLSSQPSNYSQALRKRDRPVAPRDVKRAIDYIHANLAEPITLACLVRASGVAGRTLLKHFREVHGVSPMRFLRNLRLERVREELVAGNVDRVATSATRWGFAHAGRFAADYRRRYGESPSATLANGHARN